MVFIQKAAVESFRSCEIIFVLAFFQISLAAVKALLRIQPTGWNILEEMDFPFALPSGSEWLRRIKRPGKSKRDIYNTLKQGLSQ